MAHVLLTGASTGIGLACATYLAARDLVVHAGVRKPADAERLGRLSPSIRPIILDVTSAEHIASAARRIESEAGDDGLLGVVNNAGIAVVGPVEHVALDDWRRQFEVNLFAQVAVTQAMLPLLRKHVAARGPGSARIVFMSSIAGRIGQPILAPYSASKAALESMADGLRIELARQHISVSLVEPGAIQSEIWAKGEQYTSAVPVDSPAMAQYGPEIKAVETAAKQSAADALPGQAVAQVVHRCLSARKPPTRQLVGRDAKVAALAKRFLPDRAFDGFIRRFLKL